MDLNDPKMAKLVLLGIGLAGLLYVYFGTSLLPVTYRAQAAETKDLQGRYESLSLEINRARQSAKNLPHLEAEYATLQEKWEEEISEIPFDYGVLDEHYEEMYQNEKQTKSLLYIFAAIAIFISCLGLFGLASFMAERRTKEIGVRKVLGASSSSLVGLINREVIYVLSGAIVVGSVAGYYLCGMLLDEMFAFRMALGPIAAVVASITVVLVTALTIGYQVYSAASANPVESLRVE